MQKPTAIYRRTRSLALSLVRWDDIVLYKMHNAHQFYAITKHNGSHSLV